MSVSNQAMTAQPGRNKSIATKILLVASISLIYGLLIVGFAALYLAKKGLVSLR